MNIALFIADSNGSYPVPASRGGAVSILVEHLVKNNSELRLLDMEIISFHDAEAERLSKQYNNVKFTWIKVPKIVGLLDRLTFKVIKTFFKSKKALSYRTIWSLLYYIFKSSNLLKHNTYEKIVLENNVPLAWIIKLSGYQGEYYYHFHNVPRIHANATDIFERCTGFLCVSQYVKNQILSKESRIGTIDEQKVKILYNCIDTKQFSRDPKKREQIRNKYGIENDAKILLFVGRLSEEKGIDKLLEAVTMVRHKTTILIVGNYLHGAKIKDEYLLKLQQFAQELDDKVLFTGYISQNEIHEIYNAADIAVLPSMWDEPAGLTMVEAMACGLPVITTKSGGIPEYAGNCSILLERNDQLARNIADSIDGLLDKNIAYITDTAVSRVQKEFDADGYLLRFMDAIENRH